MKTYSFRLPPKTEILTAVRQFCQKYRIQGGYLAIIGAIDQARLAHFDPASQLYYEKTFHQQLEIASCSGIISQLNQKIHLHIHAVLADRELKSYAGHLKFARVNPTAEVFIFQSSQKIKRKKDRQSGLDLLENIYLPTA